MDLNNIEDIKRKLIEPFKHLSLSNTYLQLLDEEYITRQPVPLLFALIGKNVVTSIPLEGIISEFDLSKQYKWYCFSSIYNSHALDYLYNIQTLYKAKLKYAQERVSDVKDPIEDVYVYISTITSKVQSINIELLLNINNLDPKIKEKISFVEKWIENINDTISKIETLIKEKKNIKLDNINYDLEFVLSILIETENEIIALCKTIECNVNLPTNPLEILPGINKVMKQINEHNYAYHHIEKALINIENLCKILEQKTNEKVVD